METIITNWVNKRRMRQNSRESFFFSLKWLFLFSRGSTYEHKKVKALEEKSIKFLCQAYLIVRENYLSKLTFAAVLVAVDLDHADCDEIEAFLISRMFIRRKTGGGINGQFAVTHKGFLHIEKLILDGQLASRQAAAEGDASVVDKVDMKSDVLEERKRRDSFLRQLYEIANGDLMRPVAREFIAEKMGLTEIETNNYTAFWLRVGHLKSLGNQQLLLTKKGKKAVEQAVLKAEAKSEVTTESATRGPNQDTEYKLNELRQLRLDHKKNGEVTIGWIKACERVGIRPETVKEHDLTLRRRWYDADY